MPKGMLQALLNIAPNSKSWTPIDLSYCISRNTEATDSMEDVVRAVGNLGTPGDPTLQAPEPSPAHDNNLTRTFPRMRTLHDSRRDWLSEEELWLCHTRGRNQ